MMKTLRLPRRFAQHSYARVAFPAFLLLFWHGQGAFAETAEANQGTFSVTSSAPAVSTLPATNLTATGAVLQGTVNPGGLETQATFYYGRTTSYGSRTPTTNIGSGTVEVPVGAALTGLSPNTLYHYKLSAMNGLGLRSGADLTFETPNFGDAQVGLPGVADSAVAWGDYDNDGLLDVLLTGSRTSQVWRNMGNGFTNINVALPGIQEGSVAWGDYDNDGRLDILLTGDARSPIAQVWRNTESGFTNINAGLPGVLQSSAVWADYDNDGRLDILLTGASYGGAISQIWRNTGRGFVRFPVSLPAVYHSAVAWADYDNDGWLDILLTGDAPEGPIAQVWRNTGAGFTNINANLPGLEGGSAIAWGDYDHDGWLDIDLNSQVWRNSGMGFAQIDAGLPGISAAPAAWGDYDNDGWLDLLLNDQVWRNTGTGFTQINAGLLPLYLNGSVAWGDYDNDARLDILLTGQGPSYIVSQVYRNFTATSNTPPGAPAGLRAYVTGLGIRLEWNAAHDTETPAGGLTYNLRLGTTPGGFDIVSPHSASTGFRRVPKMGNQQHRLFGVVTNLPPGTYYWSVQTIDTALAGSPFADEAMFTIVALAPSVTTLPPASTTVTSVVLDAVVNPNASPTTVYFEYGLTTDYGNVTVATNVGGGIFEIRMQAAIDGLSPNTLYHYRVVAWNEVGTNVGADVTFVAPFFTAVQVDLVGIKYSAVAWGDYDNDGRLDFVLSGDTGSNLITQVWRNTGDGFTNIYTDLPGVAYSAVSWADYDSDGRLDIFLSGNTYSNRITQIWRNTGAGFTNIEADLPGVSSGSITGGDYDNDGRLDILLCGRRESEWLTQVWRNTGHGFTNVNAGLLGVQGSASWGDFDNDGRLDILLNGFGAFLAADFTQIWKNTGDGFTNIDAGLPGISLGSTYWGDYDNDGRLDFLLSGYNIATSARLTQVWRNTGSGFTNINANLPGGSYSDAAWGDYDNDGRLDFVLTGWANSGKMAQIWQNTGLGFTNVQTGLPGVHYGSVAWGDYDNDGDLDLLLTGHASADFVSNLYENHIGSSNSPPVAPSDLAAAVTGTGVTLSWDAATDAQTPSPGLTYNLRVGTVPGGVDIVSPQADPLTGFRRVPQMGNAQHNLSAILTNLQPGTLYYWSVQAVDTAFAGSLFAEESVFMTGYPPPEFLSITAQPGPAYLLECRGEPEVVFTLQTSANLIHWTDRTNLTAGTDGLFEYLDTTLSNTPTCFYRLR